MADSDYFFGIPAFKGVVRYVDRCMHSPRAALTAEQGNVPALACGMVFVVFLSLLFLFVSAVAPTLCGPLLPDHIHRHPDEKYTGDDGLALSPKLTPPKLLFQRGPLLN